MEYGVCVCVWLWERYSGVGCYTTMWVVTVCDRSSKWCKNSTKVRILYLISYYKMVLARLGCYHTICTF